MSLETIWDAIARQAAEVEGVKAAYATSKGGQGSTVKAFPDDVADGPVAIVDYTGSELLNVGGFEHIAHDFEIELWVPLGTNARSYAVALLAPMFERFVAAYRVNVALYGTAFTSQLLGSSGFEDDALPANPDKTFLVQSIAIRAQEARSVTPALGPSS